MDLRTLSALAAMIDYNCFSPDITEVEVVKACKEAEEWTFASICVSPEYVWLANEELRHGVIAVGSIISHPSGRGSTANKRKDAELARLHGALSIDWVVSPEYVSAAFSSTGEDRKIARHRLIEEVKAIVESMDRMIDGATRKVTINCDLLNIKERTWIGNLVAVKCGESLQFITALSDFQAPVAGVSHLTKTAKRVSRHLRTQAGGYIRTLSDVIALRESGASRISTAYAPEIMREAKALGWQTGLFN